MAASLNAYLFVGAVLIVCGVVCMATKRNGIGVLMGVELVLNGANVNFVAFSRFTDLGLDGQVFSLFVIVCRLRYPQPTLRNCRMHRERPSCES